MAALGKEFQRRLEAEAVGRPVGTLQAWRAQWLSFSGGGAAWMDTWGMVEGMRTWHARAFLRLVLRQLPEGISSPEVWAAWRCSGPAAACKAFRDRDGTAVVAHASVCGEQTTRHHAYAGGVEDVLHAFPGRPHVRVEVSGIPDGEARMDRVVTGALSPAEGDPGAPPDTRALLIDFSLTEPMCGDAMAGGAHATAGVAAKIRREEKEKKYGERVDAERHRFVPWAVETWGRHDKQLVTFLRGVAEIAAADGERPSAADDEGERRRVHRVRDSIFSTWMQRLSAGLVVAVAEHFDARFRPLRGAAARRRYRGHVPQGLHGRCELAEGTMCCSGRVRSLEPRFVFALPSSFGA